MAPSPAVTRGAGRARGARPVGNGGARPPLPDQPTPSPFAAPGVQREGAGAQRCPLPARRQRGAASLPRVTQTIVTQHPPPARATGLAIAAARARNGGGPAAAAQLSAARRRSPGGGADVQARSRRIGCAAEAGALASRYDA